VGVQSGINIDSPGLHYDLRFIIMNELKRSKSQIQKNDQERSENQINQRPPLHERVD